MEFIFTIMNPNFHITLIFALLCTHLPFCTAGVNSLVVVSNLSPYNIKVNFNGEEKCMYRDFTRKYILSYYNAYTGIRDNREINLSKNLTGITDLGSSTVKGLAGEYTILSQAFKSFETEIDGGGLFSCFGRDSYRGFDISIDSVTTSYLYKDPANANWEITQKKSDGSSTRIDIGRGGYFNLGIYAEQLAALHGLEKMYQIIKDGNRTIAPDLKSLNFNSFYADIAVDRRSACIMAQDAVGIYDCLITGVALLIYDKDEIVAMPLPNIGRKWN